MRHLKFYILTILMTIVLFSYGQKIGSIKIDTTQCQVDDNKLNLADIKVKTALAGAEKYIESIVGTSIVRNNIWFDYCQSSESGFQIYSKNIQQLKRLREDTCYELHYFVVDKKDTIGYFQLLIDRNGKPMKYDYGADLYNQPQLIKGFKKHFSRQFKTTYSQAAEIGKKKGLGAKPFLTCEIENKFHLSGNEVFIKVKYYWSFFQVWDGGHHASLDINAETGQIEKENYVPRMPG